MSDSIFTRESWPFRAHPTDFEAALARGLYRAFGLRPTDGDTVTAWIDWGWHEDGTKRIRLAGVDTPETIGTSGDEYDRAVRAKEKTASLTMGFPLLVRGTGEMSFRRGVGDVYVPVGSYPRGVRVLAYDELAAPSDRAWVDLGSLLVALNLADRVEA